MADGIVVTVGPSGGGYDYTSIETANADIPADITGTAGDYVIEIYSGVNLNGFDKPNRTTDTAHRIVYRAAAGEEVNGLGVGAGFESNVAANSDAFIGTFTQSTNDTHVDFIGLKIIHLAGGGGTDALYYDDALSNRFFGCYIKSEVSRSLQTENGGSAGIYMENCILAESAGGGTEHNNIGGGAFIEYYRCTIANTGGNGFGDRGFGDRDNLRIRNCLSYGNSGSDFQAKIDQSDCDFLASGDGTASEADTTSFTNRTSADFEDYAGGNYNLASGSSLQTAGEGGEPIGATLGSAPATSESPDADVDIAVSAPAFSASAEATLPQPSSDAAFTVNAPTFAATCEATLPQPQADIAYSVSSPVFAGSADVTLPQPNSDVAYSISAPTFSASAEVTLPQPSADTSLTVSAPTFSATASATIPGFNASVAFTVGEPVFSATAEVTQPQPRADVSYAMQSPTFAGQASATLPNPSAIFGITLDAPQFSAQASATEPGFNANVSLNVDAPIFSASGSATLPQPDSSVSLTVPEPVFSVVAIVGGIAIIVDDESNINVPARS